MTQRVYLGTYPTPVEHLHGADGSWDLWVKRDDLTNARYGGNKVRKLERILADARAGGARRIVTVGAAGSHHVLATTIYGVAAGFTVEAVLIPQPRTDHVAMDLRASLAQGLVAFPARAWTMPFVLARRILAGSHYVPIGGSSASGSMGYVDAARELAEQVRRGELPEPDTLVVTLGSGGTAAGLAAGLELESMKTRVVAVCVAKPAFVLGFRAKRLARACVRLAGGNASQRRGAADRLVIESRFCGAGYGCATEAGEHAMVTWTSALASHERHAATADVYGAHAAHAELDGTYTAKAFAAAVELAAARRQASVGSGREIILYWHTLSSAPMGPLLPGKEERDLAPRLLRLLT